MAINSWTRIPSCGKHHFFIETKVYYAFLSTEKTTRSLCLVLAIPFSSVALALLWCSCVGPCYLPRSFFVNEPHLYQVILISGSILSFCPRYCDNKMPPWQRSKEVIVVFHSDGSGTASGFKASYSFINESEGRTLDCSFVKPKEKLHLFSERAEHGMHQVFDI